MVLVPAVKHRDRRDQPLLAVHDRARIARFGAPAGSKLNVFTNLKGLPAAVAAAPSSGITQDFLLP